MSLKDFSKESNATPELRFPEFDGIWESKPLGVIYKERSEKNVGYLELLAVTMNDGIKKRSDVEGSNNASADKRNYKRVYENDIVYNSMRMWQGSSGVSCYSGIVSPAYTVLKNSKNQNSIYFGYLFKTLKMLHIFQRYSQGITSDTWNLKYPQLSKIFINLPSLQEQNKIAAFLSTVDKKIEKQQSLIEQLKQLKKGYMQQMFSQELRFPEFTDDWSRKKLIEILDYLQPTPYLVSNTEYSNEYTTPVLTAGKTFLLGYTNDSFGIFKSKLPTIIFDDFTTAFQFVNFPFKAKSSAMKMLIPKGEKININFVYEAMKTIRFPLGEHKRYWISEYQYERIPYPSISEQNKITSFCSTLNRKIKTVKQQLEATQTLKKGLLQKMFV